MTIHKLPVREVPETPEETAYFDAKTWEKPVKPTYSMLYKQHKFVVGIVVGCLVMSIVYGYFQSRNFGVLNSKITRNQELGSIMEKNTETCKAFVEKNATIMEEYKTNNATILSEIEEKITRKTARVVENKEVSNK